MTIPIRRVLPSIIREGNTIIEGGSGFTLTTAQVQIVYIDSAHESNDLLQLAESSTEATGVIPAP
jgi:hypothetical protein